MSVPAASPRVPLVGAIGRLIRRRRLAASTRRLLREVAVGEAVALVAPVVARLRPIAGTRSWCTAGGTVARDGGRRWFVAGRVERSIEALRAAHGIEVAAHLDASHLEASHLEDGGRAPRDGWYVSWNDGDRPQLAYADERRLAELSTSRPAASHCDLWRCYEVAPGDLIGGETAVTVRFDGGTAQGGRPCIVSRPPAPVIDAVYTWVDDSDPAWRAARADARRSTGNDPAGDPASDPAGDAARYRNHDELRYALRSLWMYGDWVRRIHVVTAGHLPAWLVEDDRLRVVRHDEFCPADAVPTFNSHAIESRLHHIDGLAEHFVYFNDDMFVGRAVEPSTFFELGDPARPRVFLDEAVVPDDEHLPPGMFRAARRTTELVHALTGRHDDRLVRHAGYPCRRSLLKELEAVMPDEFAAVARHRFRHRDDVSVPASLAPHYWLATGQAVRGHSPTEYVSLGHELTSLRMRRLLRSRRFDMYCLNSTDAGGPVRFDERALTRWMHRLAPIPSPWERR